MMSNQVYVNGVFSGGFTNTAKFSLYVSPYLVANQGGRYTKHIYAGSQRIVSKVGDFASYGSDPRRIEYAGANTDGLSVNYKAKYAAQQQVIKDNYKTFDVPYNGTDNDNYADGEGFCCNDGYMEAAMARARKAQARAVAKSFKDPDNYENLQFFYHPDHLGSSSFITNLEGEVVQHIEYVPFGEVFIEERNSVWNTPYLFNAKEFDEETGMYYYGARYYEPRLSLWMSVDKLADYAPSWTPYRAFFNNPIRFFDPTGNWEWDNEGNLVANKKDNVQTLANFLGVKDKDAKTFLVHNGISFNKNSNPNIQEGTVLKKNTLWIHERPKNAIRVNNNVEAVAHYLYGNGESADVGDIATFSVIVDKKFQMKHNKITHEKVAPEGNFSIDLTDKIFHIGHTNVDYSVSTNGKASSVSYSIFSRDGFWDPDFIDEKTLGRIPYINEWTKTKPDGMGPNLERFGGKPYHYLPRKFTFYFKPVK